MRNRANSQHHFEHRSRRSGPFLLGLCIIPCMVCLGCLVLPVPAKKKVSGISETRDKIDTTFIRAGSTTREEVLRKLEWVDTGIKEETLFVGRWSSSSSALVWGSLGGNSAGKGDTGVQRDWNKYNLMVEFDGSGVVKESRTLSDSDLLKALSSWVRHSKPGVLELDLPVKLNVEYRHSSGDYYIADLMLERDSIAFHEWNTDSRDFTVSIGQIRSLEYPSATPGNKALPQNFNCRLEFHENTKAGSHLTLAMDVPSLFTLIQYVEVNRPRSYSQ